jgi:hypothetical protein
MKTVFGLFKRIALVFMVFSYPLSYGSSIWIPSTLSVTPAGEIKQSIPLPNQSPDVSKGKISSGGFYPPISGAYTNFKRIFALQNSFRNVSQFKTVEGNLLPSRNPKGYQVLEQSTTDIGVPIPLGAGIDIASAAFFSVFGVSFSLPVRFSKGYTASWSVKTLAEAKKKRKVKIPYDTKTLVENWNLGDSVSFRRQLGIGINVAVGNMAARVGVGVVLNSSWMYSLIRPLDSDIRRPLIKLTYAKAKDAGIKLEAGNALGGLSLEKIFEKSKSFSYLIDLSNNNKKDLTITSGSKAKKKMASIKGANALMAYKLATMGNLVVADLLSTKDMKFGVKKIKERKEKSRGLYKKGGISIPFLFNANFSAGKAYSISNTKLMDDDTHVENITGIYSKKTETSGRISREKRRVSFFSGFVQQITPKGSSNEGRIRRYAGGWKYLYLRSKVKRKKVLKELKRVRYMIGFMKELKGLKIPTKDIGDFQVEVDLKLSNYATDELIKVAEKMGERGLVNEAVAYLEGFFSNVKDVKDEICIGGAGPKFRMLRECKFTTKNQVKSAMKTAYRALMKLKKFRDKQNYKGFVQAYADFGKGFINSRFSMKTFLRMLRYKCTPTFFNKLKGQSEVTAENLKKVCPLKVISIDGRPSKVPYEVKISIKGTNIAPWEKVLYSYKN